MRRALNMLLGFATTLLLAGCSTVPDRYIPNVTGSLEDGDPSNILKVSIEPDNPEASIGEPIVFRATVMNVSSKALWVPRDPAFFFTWIYPDGRHDSFVYEPQRDQFYSEHDAILLRPGQEISRPVTIRTYYFERKGVTEFRAFLRAGRNTNPALTPFWYGEIASNSYGIMVQGAKKNSAPIDSLTKGSSPTPTS